MRTIAKYFFQGLLYITPLAVTIYVIGWGLRELNNLFDLDYPGLGIAIALVAITFIGFVGSYLIQLPLFNFIDTQLERAPLIKIIYTSVKDLLKAFMGQKKSFNKPVLVQLYENSEVRRLGFVTDQGLAMLGDESTLITVYVPHSFAISGQLFLVPPHYVTPVQSKSTEVMKYIIAGGVARMDEHGLDAEV